MSWGARKDDRVVFASRQVVHIMGIDGTWRRTCAMLDISASGARLMVEGSIEGLHLKEFFLLLSSTGLAFRRCELIRIDGDEIGVRFIEDKPKGKAARASMAR
jgi:hypothetical protein